MTEQGCQYIYGHPREGPDAYSYCGAPVAAHSQSYCARHHRMCYFLIEMPNARQREAALRPFYDGRVR